MNYTAYFNVLSYRDHCVCHVVSLYSAWFDQQAIIESDMVFFPDLGPIFPQDQSVFWIVPGGLYRSESGCIYCIEKLGLHFALKSNILNCTSHTH